MYMNILNSICILFLNALGIVLLIVFAIQLALSIKNKNRELILDKLMLFILISALLLSIFDIKNIEQAFSNLI